MNVLETMTKGEIITVRIAFSVETLAGVAHELGVDYATKEDLRSYLSDMLFRKCQKLTKDGIALMYKGGIKKRGDVGGRHNVGARYKDRSA